MALVLCTQADRQGRPLGPAQPITVYFAAHTFRIRCFKKPAEGLLASIATFTASEIFDYERLVKYST